MKKTEFKKLLETQSDVLLLDIREADEVTENTMITGAQHMPMGKVFTEAAKNNLPKDKPIVVFCRSGMRAAVIARELTALGYDIEGLEGGLNELVL